MFAHRHADTVALLLIKDPLLPQPGRQGLESTGQAGAIS